MNIGVLFVWTIPPCKATSACVETTPPKDRLAQQTRTSLIPRSIVSNATAFDMSPFVRGFQDNMSNWVSNLIYQQDGCLQMVARLSTQGRIRQEQLAQTFAHSAQCSDTITTPSSTIPTCTTRSSKTLLEHVRSKRDTYLV